MNTTDPILHLENLSVSLGRKTIIENINLSLERGEIVSLIGPNGAGKTTLVRTVLGLLKASSGRIKKQAGLRIGYMPQRLHLEKTIPLTVQRFLKMTKNTSHADITEVLQKVGAEHTAQRPMQEVSGGELQRILLARALLRKPQLLVLDEPAQGVDISGQAELYRLISNLRDELNCAVLMVSHDLHLVMSSTDRVICMNRHICCSGLPEHVSNDPAYHELFGLEATEGLALYAHHHDHAHDAEGNVVHSKESCSHG
ncbi:MAG: zinc ABC transporter ATP-binding protein ZnuC [Pseudomonadales bacterium]